MWRIHQALGFIGYLFGAKTPDQIHSPYLFELLKYIHDRSRVYYAFERIEALRTHLKKQDLEIERVDHGAGSKSGSGNRVRDIANTALSSSIKCQTIFRLLALHKPNQVMELGTSLGIMTAYLASAHDSHVHTIEGNPYLSEIAKGIARTLDLKSIDFHVGPFAEVLPDVLSNGNNNDFILIDGDHRGSALKEYYSMCKPYLAENAIVMIDDIRWSHDMYEAWQEIIKSPDVRCSLDYFGFGLLFFRKDFLEKVTMQIVPQRWPPRLCL